MAEKDVRELVKSRFEKAGMLDSWALHCATRLGVMKRKIRPDAKMIFGGRAHLERRRKGLLDREEWRRRRLLPFVSYGDSQKIHGIQNIHLVDEKTIVVKIGRKEGSGRSSKTVTQRAVLRLAPISGNGGFIVRHLVELCARPDKKDRINLTYLINDTHIGITFDPLDLLQHPQRRNPVRAAKDRALGIDLNPNWIGLSAVENTSNPSSLKDPTLLEHALVKLDMDKDASPELVRETLAAAADRAIGLARKHRCGVITVEQGLGKLRSSGRNRSLNRLLNYWARTIFVAMLQRRARLAGIEVLEVWGGYSSTIGNLAFEAPDACASVAEIARRGLARMAGKKDVLPAYGEGTAAGLRKDLRLPVDAESWADVHRTIKAAKIGYRRPHPDVLQGARDPDVHGTLASHGHAVVRLRRRRRPGLVFRAARARPDEVVRNLSNQRGGVPAARVSKSKSR